MSIYKRCSTKGGEPERVGMMISYIFDRSKTGDSLCHGSGTVKETAYDDMMFIKQLYCQTDGRQYLHWVLSHDDGITKEVADAVGQDVLQLLSEDYQAVMATHVNTNNVHSHFIINPVNLRTGKKFNESKREMLDFRDKINVIFEEFGLKKVGTVELDESIEAEEDEEIVELVEYEDEDFYLEMEADNGVGATLSVKYINLPQDCNLEELFMTDPFMRVPQKTTPFKRVLKKKTSPFKRVSRKPFMRI